MTALLAMLYLGLIASLAVGFCLGQRATAWSATTEARQLAYDVL